MATEIGNVDGTPDPDSADGQFPQPLPDWLVQATNEFMACSSDEQLLRLLDMLHWIENRGSPEDLQFAKQMRQDLRLPPRR